MEAIMRRTFIINLFFSIFLLSLIGCGQSDDEKIEQAMKQMQTDYQARSNEVTSTADSVGGVRSNTSQVKDSSESQPLGFRELKPLLPENLSDMNRTDAAGNEDGILLTITDLGSLNGVTSMAEYRWATDDVDRVTENGYEKSIVYKGYRGFEKYNHATRNGEVQILVAGRFVVQAQGFKMEMEEIKSAMNDVDLEKIASANGGRVEKNE
jgi:hypothetical protein